jgi:hypothetical protein
MTPIYDHDKPQEHYVKLTPKTEEQIKLERLLPIGDYPFQVVSAEDKISKKGKEMIALELSVFAPDGTSRKVRDWLLDAMAFKMRHYCYAVGLGPAYESGDLTAEMCVGRSGTVTLKIEEQEGYEPKNAVKDYVPAEGEQKAAARQVVKAPVNAASDANEPPF